MRIFAELVTSDENQITK